MRIYSYNNNTDNNNDFLESDGIRAVECEYFNNFTSFFYCITIFEEFETESWHSCKNSGKILCY